ncbi:MAG: hypothetical protein K0R19_2841 [Bacillota bacterium]|nr:hypothetical protein [Bacillota bacterium]
MDKQSLTRDMKAFVGGGAFITPTQTAKYMRLSPGRMPEFLQGLEFIKTGKAKQYHILDVAGRIVEKSQM